ncbi:MAG: helix-turn-helix domain-containing protein [Candidatus Brocadiae bacterium]|nr:helix-turn-helix domain-containing protein [Candidatus Brocadiia bacterium]
MAKLKTEFFISEKKVENSEKILQNKNDVHLGKVFAKALKRKDWTQKQLADAMGVSPATVSEWINDRKINKWKTFLLIIEKLDIVSDLFPNYRKVDHLFDLIVTSKRIQSIRLMLAMEIKKFAEQLGINETRIKEIEEFGVKGEGAGPSYLDLEKIQDTFGIKPSDFLLSNEEFIQCLARCISKMPENEE